MAKRRAKTTKKRRRPAKKGFLGAIAPSSSTGKKTLQILTVGLAAGAGALVGGASPHTFYPGILLTGIGAYKGEPHLIALGGTMAFSTGKLRTTSAATNGIGSLASIWEDTKARVKDFGSGLAEKSYLTKLYPQLGEVDTMYLNGDGRDWSNWDREVAKLKQSASINGYGSDLLELNSGMSGSTW
jgi:hypothetical protein